MKKLFYLMIFIISQNSFAMESGNAKGVRNDFTSLRVAAANGNMEQIRSLIHKGTNLDKKDKSGRTALMYTIIGNHTEAAKLLIGNGADVNIADKKGRTALMWAAQRRHKDIVKLLMEAGADINAQRSDGLNSLAIAFNAITEEDMLSTRETDRRKIMQLLITSGAEYTKDDAPCYQKKF